MTLVRGSTVVTATCDAVAKRRDSRASSSADEPPALKEVASGPPAQRTLRVAGAVAPNSPITAFVHVGGLIGGRATGALARPLARHYERWPGR